MQQDLLGELSLPATNSTVESASATPTATSTVSTRQEDLGQTDPASGHKSQPDTTQGPDPATASSQEPASPPDQMGEHGPLAANCTESPTATPPATPTATQIATHPGDTQDASPSPADSAPPAKPHSAESQETAAASKSSADAYFKGRRSRPTQLDREVRAVKLSDISGVDDEIEEFLRQHDILTEVSIQADRWTQALQDWTVQNLHLMLWVCKGRLVHLGSGRALTLARRLARHDQTLPATIITSKTLSREDKLLAQAHEELIMSAFHRPGPGHPASMVKLHDALIQAGIGLLKRPGIRELSSATGVSHVALKKHWPEKATK